MRLIDADAFLKSEIERCGCVPVIGSCTADNEIFKFVLEQQPTVEPVCGEWIVHEWKEAKKGLVEPSLLLAKYECSRCHYLFENNSNFCPNCGADMRKDVE